MAEKEEKIEQSVEEQIYNLAMRLDVLERKVEQLVQNKAKASVITAGMSPYYRDYIQKRMKDDK